MAFAAAEALAGALPPPRQASLRALRGLDGLLIDRALLLRFDAATSATGDDLVEFHCHGGPAVVRAIERALLSNPHVRAAAPGAFTRQALANGRIDLAQAQGLADLLVAETETQRRHAIMASEGHVSRLVRDWMTRLVGIAAEIEAAIDYGEEGDVVAEAVSLASIDGERRAVAGEIAEVLAAPPVERWQEGIRIVLAGPPNAGKSTLLNCLSGRDAAIVSPVAGTTRDRVEVPVQRDGVGYLLTDTAGLRGGSPDPIERLGIERARSAIETADLVLWLGDEPPPVSALHVHARVDLPERSVVPVGADLAVSAHRPATIDALWQRIAERTAAASTPIMPLHRTEREHCEACLDALLSDERDIVLLAEMLRSATASLAAITGEHATEAMLDRLFARFCVGK